jgi:hypothetical protein
MGIRGEVKVVSQHAHEGIAHRSTYEVQVVSRIGEKSTEIRNERG